MARGADCVGRVCEYEAAHIMAKARAPQILYALKKPNVRSASCAIRAFRGIRGQPNASRGGVLQDTQFAVHATPVQGKVIWCPRDRKKLVADHFDALNDQGVVPERMRHCP